jgi:TonB family protein
MLVISNMLLAGAVVAATPVTPAPWFEFHDYPMKAFERNAEGVTEFELLVAPDGRIANCAVTQSSGHQDLDRATCHLANKRVRFNPARDGDGQAVYGVYRSQALWAIPENTIAATAGPDLEVTVNQLPAGTAEPPVVKLAYAVDAQGRASSCTLLPSSLKQPPVLVELGCKELMSKIGSAPVVGPAGLPVAAIKTAAVKFNSGS